MIGGTTFAGFIANTVNNGFCVMSQFYIDGVLKKIILGGEDRPFTSAERIASGASSGALSGVVCGPIELIMIQQQKKGGGLLSTALSLIKDGPMTFFRGTGPMMMREGIYAGGFLGVMPVTREMIRKNFPDSLGKTEDSARFGAACVAGPLCGFASHPPDTIKTCMQGDIERVTYGGFVETGRTIVATKGAPFLWAGFPWRLFRCGPLKRS